MNIFVYSLICYAITTIISVGVVAIILFINHIMTRKELAANKQNGEE